MNKTNLDFYSKCIVLEVGIILCECVMKAVMERHGLSKKDLYEEFDGILQQLTAMNKGWA